ncbi:hypothetical protein N9060_01725 [Arenicella sp.]|nr:hypothetical protein [Arenicella sp.]
MMKFALPLALAAALFSVSCNSTGTTGNPYEYNSSRIGVSKRVSAASVDGRFVILDDGSIWNISWSDAKDASRWRSGDTVSVTKGGGGEFPYVLNHERGSSVSARHGKKLD